MNALFVELPPFERYRSDYLSDDDFLAFQQMLLDDPKKGDVIQGTGGLRKVRFANKSKGQGKRSGIRVIYYYWESSSQFWLFTLYGKGEASDLADKEKKQLADYLNLELKERGND